MLQVKRYKELNEILGKYKEGILTDADALFKIRMLDISGRFVESSFLDRIVFIGFDKKHYFKFDVVL